MGIELSKLNDYINVHFALSDGKGFILAIHGMCPYLRKMKDKEEIFCECAKFKFPDSVARREIIYAFCAHPTDFKNCAFKQVMDRYYYERKFGCESNG